MGLKPTIGGLFFGAGGMELGFDWEGFETVFAVEIEEYAQAVIRKRWPDAKIYADVTKTDFSTVPKVDVLTGGFPCQDISIAGKGIGITGSRSSLWKYFKEAIRIIRPRIAVIENVPALVNEFDVERRPEPPQINVQDLSRLGEEFTVEVERRQGLTTVLCDLAEIGYDAEWSCLSAASVGAFHKRERIFIIAYPNSERHDCAQHGELQGQCDLSEEREATIDGQREERINEVIEPCANVADSESKRCGEEGEHCTGSEERSSISNQVLANTDCERSQERNTSSESGKQEQCSGRIDPQRGIWSTQSRICGVSHGVPCWTHRIKLLGNAVVPQVAQVIAQAIKEGEGW